MGSIYRKGKQGEWRRIRRKDFRIACCDCGLVHRYNFKLVPSRHGKGRHLANQGYRDNRATAAVRRYMTLEDLERISAVIQKKIRLLNRQLKRKRNVRPATHHRRRP